VIKSSQAKLLQPLIGDKRGYKGEVTGQRDKISKLFHSCIQTSRYRGDKSEKRELTSKNE